MIHTPVILVLSGPSGVGKSTVMAEVMGARKNVFFSVSFTTRTPRPGERPGIDYNFTSRTEFERMLRDHELLEHTCYNGNYYGTSRRQIEENLARGFDVLLDIEVEGAANIRRIYSNAVLAFVAPPSMEELERRLRGRETETEESIQRRLKRAREEYQCIPDYDYLIINDKVPAATAQLLSILQAEDCRVRNRMQYIEGVLLR